MVLAAHDVWMKIKIANSLDALFWVRPAVHTFLGNSAIQKTWQVQTFIQSPYSLSPDYITLTRVSCPLWRTNTQTNGSTGERPRNGAANVAPPWRTYHRNARSIFIFSNHLFARNIGNHQASRCTTSTTSWGGSRGGASSYHGPRAIRRARILCGTASNVQNGSGGGRPDSFTTARRSRGVHVESRAAHSRSR